MRGVTCFYIAPPPFKEKEFLMKSVQKVQTERSKELIALAHESTAMLNWLGSMLNSYSVIDRYCVRLIEDMQRQSKWDTNAERTIQEMIELSEQKIEALTNALSAHRAKHDRIMVALENESE